MTMDLYRIHYPLHIKVDRDKYSEIRNELFEMVMYKDYREPFFDEIIIWVPNDNPGDGQDKYLHSKIEGQWSVRDWYNKIKELANGNLKIGHPAVTLEQAIQEVNLTVKDAQAEKYRQARVAESYNGAIDQLKCLKKYGYEKDSGLIIQTKAYQDRQAILTSIRDELRNIGDMLKVIGSQM